MNLKRIITAAERLNTLNKRANVSNDRDSRRDEIIAEFKSMATDLGKLATKFRHPQWTNLGMAIVDLHSVTVHADEGRVGTFVPMGGDAAVLTQLHGFAAILGFVLADVATAAADAANDDAAMAAVEGGRIAAE